MSFDEELAKNVVTEFINDNPEEKGLYTAFVEICRFLDDNPGRLSWRTKNKPTVNDENGLKALAEKYFSGFIKSDFPVFLFDLKIFFPNLNDLYFGSVKI